MTHLRMHQVHYSNDDYCGDNTVLGETTNVCQDLLTTGSLKP